MESYERLLKYVQIATQSDENSRKVPTTDTQFNLANVLVDELMNMGIEAKVDDKCYVYAVIPATDGMEKCKKIGFIAHMDTAPDFNGDQVKPRIIENYQGQDVKLGTSGRVLRKEEFPHLENLKGQTIITTDGTTLLGSDDKSGIAEIMTMAEKIMETKKPHGQISIAFTPDEEVGRGADYFDVKRFDADLAYTLDGGQEGEIVFENFNACSARFHVEGVNVHPGSSKNVMVNALLVAMEINAMLPGGEIPAHTEGYEGFYHLLSLNGTVEHADSYYIIRDHDDNFFEARKNTVRHIEKILNEKYGAGTVKLVIEEQYRNMKCMVEPHKEMIEYAKKAIMAEGLTPLTFPERGGTDGSRLSFMGLPCPNLGTGGYAFHGPYEHVSVQGMNHCVNIILNIIELYAKEGIR